MCVREVCVEKQPRGVGTGTTLPGVKFSVGWRRFFHTLSAWRSTTLRTTWPQTSTGYSHHKSLPRCRLISTATRRRSTGLETCTFQRRVQFLSECSHAVGRVRPAITQRYCPQGVARFVAHRRYDALLFPQSEGGRRAVQASHLQVGPRKQGFTRGRLPRWRLCGADGGQCRRGGAANCGVAAHWAASYRGFLW